MQIAKVQESLARKALYQPNTHFDDLFSLVTHPHWLWVATESVLQSSNAHIPGVDGITKESITGDTQVYAQALAADLKASVYKPQAVKQLHMPDMDGKIHAQGIPTLRDRMVQEAVRMVLEPILESHFLDCSIGLRPARHAMDAIHLSESFASDKAKMWWIVRGDIRDGWSNIPHSKLRGVLAQYIKDKKLLGLLANLLTPGIVEKGKLSLPNQGVLQAGVLASLLVNAYLHELDKIWWSRYGSLTGEQQSSRRAQGLGNVQLLRYADDFVLMTNGNKEGAFALHAEFAEVVHELGLELSAEKTAVTHLNDGFDFLGFHLQRVYNRTANKNMLLVKPARRSIDAFKEAARAITARDSSGDDVPNKIRALNALTRRWAHYYRFANVSEEFQDLEHFVHMRMYYWLKAKHSNLSARESVKKHVVQTYLTQYTGTRKTWGLDGTQLLPMTTIERKRYAIHWPQERNPYLEYANATGATQRQVAEETPLREFWPIKTYSDR
ncbi:MAG: reverse transcriptase domain-containing protein [Chloroflexota bacterium]|nr:reverse transcriptase domain-containing protein [Chloroflexota bacterium]